jgi:hypothetical protein
MDSLFHGDVGKLTTVLLAAVFAIVYSAEDRLCELLGLRKKRELPIDLLAGAAIALALLGGATLEPDAGVFGVAGPVLIVATVLATAYFWKKRSPR